MHLPDFTTLTFDCYGTLIDWKSGIHTALHPLLQALGTPQTEKPPSKLSGFSHVALPNGARRHLS